MMKKTGILLISVLLVFILAGAAQASGLTITSTLDTEQAQESQFPFVAETGELAINIRGTANAKAAPVGRLERGEQLTVLAGTFNAQGEIWYEVELSDGTRGYVRSDLLIPAEQAESERAANPVPDHQLIGNRKSKKYHETWCHTLPKESNRVYFSSVKEAEAEGYVHCKNCD